jgi:stress responsive alpha/beta barrel protein
VIQHIVLLKWKPDTTEEQILEAVRHAEHLPNEIKGVDSLTIGRNRVRHDHGFTHALIVRLSSEEALKDYLEHPLRRQYIEDYLKPLEADRIEIDVPVDLALRAAPHRDWEYGASIGMGHLVDEP